MQRSGGCKIQLRNRKGEGALKDMVGVSPLSQQEEETIEEFS